jgi:hypothetical protein
MRYSGFVDLYAKADSVKYFRNLGNTDECLPIATDNSFDLTGQRLTIFPLNLRLQKGFADLEKIKDGWDSYGAKAPSAQTIRIAKYFAGLFPEAQQPEIAPHPAGLVSMSWKSSGKKYSVLIEESEQQNPKWKIEWTINKFKTEWSPLALQEIASLFLRELCS